MHTVDVLLVCAAVLVTACFAAVLARQRYMLHVAGAVPIAVRHGHRWHYGVGRYVGGELRWYRALGLGTRPSRVLRRGEVALRERHAPDAGDLHSLPPTAVIIECSVAGEAMVLALGESAFTGFVSWVEAAPERRHRHS